MKAHSLARFLGQLKEFLLGSAYRRARSDFFRSHVLNAKLIEDIIEKMENWRENFNGRYVGYGIDPYFRREYRHYPMAYAFFIRGFVEMYKYSGNMMWLDKACNALELLEKLAIEKNFYYCWGLPFAWHKLENEPYGITTAFVGHAYLDVYEQTFESKYLRVVEKIINWAINKLGYSNEGREICFWYSPRIKIKVLNSHAELIALIARYFQLTNSNAALLEIVKKGYRYIEQRKHSGMWPYKNENLTFDFHVNYIIESMYYLSKCQVIPNLNTDNMIVKPYVKLLSTLMNRNGSLRQHNRTYKEARLWGYGACLYAGTLTILSAEGEDKFIVCELMYRIFNYVLSNLYSNSGPFFFRFHDKEIKYIRHEAHIFYALTKLITCDDFLEEKLRD